MVAVPSNPTSPHGQAFGVKLTDVAGADTFYRLGTLNQSGLIEGPDLAVPRVDTTGSAEEIRSTGPERVFARFDFTGGSGLALAHRAQPGDTDPTRYWDSHMMDVQAADEASPAQIVPLPPTYLLDEGNMSDGGAETNLGGSTKPTLLAWGPRVVYITPNSKIKITEFGEIIDPNDWDTFATFFDEGVQLGGGVIMNGDLFVSSTVGILRFSPSGATSNYNAQITNNPPLFAVKGRLLFGGTDLREAHNLTADPQGSPADTQLLPVFTGAWAGVLDLGAFVLAANKVNGYVYTLTVNPETGDWTQQGQSRIRANQNITGINAIAGRILIATQETQIQAIPVRTTLLNQTRVNILWSASISDDGSLTDIQFIRELDTEVNDIVVWGNDMYVLAYPDVWRYDPTRDALHRHTTLIGGAGSLENKTIMIQQVGIPPATERDRLFVYSNGRTQTSSTAKLFSTFDVVGGGEDATITLPAADFFTAEEKHWTTVTTEQASNPAGLSLTGMWQVWYATTLEALHDPNMAPGGAWTFLGQTTNVNKNEFTLNVTSRYMTIRLVGSEANGNVRPLIGVSVEGFLASDETLFTLPLDVSDNVEQPGRKPFRLPGKGKTTHTKLRALEGQPVTAEFIFDDHRTVTGLIEKVSAVIPGYTPRGSHTLIASVTIRGKET